MKMRRSLDSCLMIRSPLWIGVVLTASLWLYHVVLAPLMFSGVYWIVYDTAYDMWHKICAIIWQSMMCRMPCGTTCCGLCIYTHVCIMTYDVLWHDMWPLSNVSLLYTIAICYTESGMTILVPAQRGISPECRSPICRRMTNTSLYVIDGWQLIKMMAVWVKNTAAPIHLFLHEGIMQICLIYL